MSIHPGTDLYLHWGYTAGSQPFQTPGYIHRRGILIGSSYDQYLFACLVHIDKMGFSINFFSIIFLKLDKCKWFLLIEIGNTSLYFNGEIRIAMTFLKHLFEWFSINFKRNLVFLGGFLFFCFFFGVEGFKEC